MYVIVRTIKYQENMGPLGHTDKEIEIEERERERASERARETTESWGTTQRHRENTQQWKDHNTSRPSSYE